MAESEARELVVRDVVGEFGATVCDPHCTLTNVAEMLLDRDHTACIVMDDKGEIAGVVTENDLLQAHSIGVPWHYGIEAWLQSDCARLPGFLVEGLTVKPTTLLTEAAVRMQQQVTTDFACRHLLVREERELPWGLLSSLDLARALCRTGPGVRILAELETETVAEVMKPRSSLPVRNKDATLGQAFEEMIVNRQNCVLITESESEDAQVYGVITARDAIRAFTQQASGKTQVEEWLRGLQHRWEPRGVPSDTKLVNAAEKMSANLLHHLVVVSPGTSDVVGVISSLDMALAMVSAQEHADAHQSGVADT
jgi:CBS domain-containing protein